MSIEALTVKIFDVEEGPTGSGGHQIIIKFRGRIIEEFVRDTPLEAYKELARVGYEPIARRMGHVIYLDNGLNVKTSAVKVFNIETGSTRSGGHKIIIKFRGRIIEEFVRDTPLVAYRELTRVGYETVAFRRGYTIYLNAW